MHTLRLHLRFYVHLHNSSATAIHTFTFSKWNVQTILAIHTSHNIHSRTETELINRNADIESCDNNGFEDARSLVPFVKGWPENGFDLVRIWVREVEATVSTRVKSRTDVIVNIKWRRLYNERPGKLNTVAYKCHQTVARGQSWVVVQCGPHLR
jgi:hypothetical protein